MSLINEALKKAQRQRHEEAVDVAAAPGAGRIAKRGRAQSANTIILLGSGALVLVVLSVVGTIYLLNRGADAPARIAAAATTPPPKAVTDDSSPIVTGPAIPPASKSTPGSSSAAPPPVDLASSAATAPAASSPLAAARQSAAEPSPTLQHTDPLVPFPNSIPNPNKATDSATRTSPPPRAETALPEIATAPAVSETAKPDEGIYQYVDALRITGVKAAGADSRVLMNDRVYRINDIVERTLGVRLIKVESNTLTFSDAQGAIYLKTF